ncbi:MAG: hypothetical protein RIC38_08820 [Chromatocurvus sp.]
MFLQAVTMVPCIFQIRKLGLAVAWATIALLVAVNLPASANASPYGPQPYNAVAISADCDDAVTFEAGHSGHKDDGHHSDRGDCCNIGCTSSAIAACLKPMTMHRFPASTSRMSQSRPPHASIDGPFRPPRT